MAFCEPSGCGIAPLPMKSPLLMSAIEAFTTATTSILSARLSVSASPLSDFAVTLLPSTFSMTPRRRTVCGACASTAVAASAATRASAARIAAVLMSGSGFAGHIGGAAPSRPTLMAGAVSDPSAAFCAAMMMNCAPGLTSAMLPGTNLTTGVFGGTMTFFSPSGYFTMMVWPSTPATVDSTSALVMVLPGSRSQGLKRAGTTPFCESMKMCRPIAFWLPSGCGIAVTPMKSPCLMSASVALTMAVTRALSASLTCMVLPSRALTVSIEPSTFSMVPRMRTGGVCDICCACAKATEVANRTPTAATPSIRRVIVVIIILPILFPIHAGGGRRGGWVLKHRSRLRYSSRRGGGRPEVGFGQSPQFRGHFGLFAEPQLKAAHRLMQQHAEAVGGAQSARCCRFDQRRHQRHIDQIGDNGVTGQPPDVGLEFRLPGHAERGGVDEQGRVAEQVIQLLPRGDLQTFEEALAQNFGAVRSAIDHRDARDAARQQRVDHRVRRAAGAEHDRVAKPAIPLRRAGVEIVQKTFDVGVGRMQKAAGDAVGLQPIIMNERRARMFDRPADDAGGADGRGHASSTTVLRRLPICGHSTSMVSPGFSHTGGSTFGPFFTGVPVQITSPALSVMNEVV